MRQVFKVTVPAPNSGGPALKTVLRKLHWLGGALPQESSEMLARSWLNKLRLAGVVNRVVRPRGFIAAWCCVIARLSLVLKSAFIRAGDLHTPSSVYAMCSG